MRDIVPRGLYLAPFFLSAVAFAAIINRLINNEAYSTAVFPFYGPTDTANLRMVAVDSALIFELVFWVSTLVIAITESILVIVTFKLINAHARNQDGPGNSSVVEFLWTIIPPLFTIFLAIASKGQLRISSTQGLVETALLGSGVLLLLISTCILLLRSVKDLKVEKPVDILPFHAEIQEQTIHVDFEGADKTIYSTGTPSLATEPEALHRGKPK